MVVVAVLIGIVLGAVLLGTPGAVLGGLLGYALAELILLKHKMEKLEQRLPPPSRARPEPTPVTRPPATGPAVSPPATPPPSVPSAAARASGFAIFDEVSASPVATESTRRPAPAVWPEPRPDVLQVVWEKMKAFVTGGNTPVRVGVILLFFGVAFLLKYAAEHSQLPVELRLVAVAVGALAMLGLGWRWRTRRGAYGLVLQGGAIGILYLTVFVALRLYELLPAGGTLALLMAMAVLSSMLAVLQNAPSLAVLGSAGGFLAPVLASTGTGSHVMLFSYYALLNAGVLGIAWFRSWRILNLTGFVFTFVISALWGYRYYQPAFFATTEPFLILFFLAYVAIAVLFALRQPPRLQGLVDGTVVFGVPLVAFGLQAYLVRDLEYGLAYSALVVALLYLVLAWRVFARRTPALRILVEAFLALGVVFATLAVPLAFEGRWTAAVWALEGAGIVWIGVRQQRLAPRAFGLLLQLAAAVSFLLDAPLASGTWPVLNSLALGRVLIAVGALASGWFLYRGRERLEPIETGMPLVLLGWGLLWWYGAGVLEIDRHVAGHEMAALLMFVAASSLACAWLGRRLAWPALVTSAKLLLPVMALLAWRSWQSGDAHPLGRLNALAWPLAFVAHYTLLRWRERETPWGPYWHAVPVWLLALLGAWECHWWIDQWVTGAGAWPHVAWALWPALLMWFMGAGWERLTWPLGRYRDTYLIQGAIPLALFLGVWSLATNLTHDGDPWPLPYLPVLNPLDVAQAFVLVTVASWLVLLRALGLQAGAGATPIRWGWQGWWAVSFLWLNAILIRTLHHWADVPLSLHGVYHSMLAQTSLSVFWAVLGLITMTAATRLGRRTAWLVGAVLLAVVVVKLFAVDLASTQTVARIVSFIVVGLLLLAVGYLSPVPPRQAEQKGPV